MAHLESQEQQVDVQQEFAAPEMTDADLADAENALESINAVQTGSIHEVMDIKGSSSLILNVEDDTKHDIESRVTKGSRAILETTVVANSDDPLPDGIVDAWIKAGKIKASFLEVDQATGEAKLTFPKQPEGVVVFKGKEVRITMKHVLYVPEQIKYAGVASKN